jgi:hypothetical protein
MPYFLARARVGLDLGEVHAGTVLEGAHLQVLLAGQRLIVPLVSLPPLVALAQAAVRRLEAGTPLPPLDGRLELGRITLPPHDPARRLDWGAIFALLDPDSDEVEFLHGALDLGALRRVEIDTSSQRLTIDRARLPELVGLLENAQRAMAGVEGERSGLVGHC